MGKKRLSKASTKISKNEKNPLNSLIKVSRPKVYITDCSNFKSLVHELTGNGRTIPSPPPPPKPQKVLEIVEVVNLEAHGEPESSMETSFDASVDSFELCNQLVSLTEELNQPFNHGEPESSMETSFDASVDSFECCNQLVSFTEELNQPYNHVEPESSVETSFDASIDSFEFCNQLVSLTEKLNQPYNHLYFDGISSDHDLSINQQTDMLTDQDFESLLLGIEQYPFSSSYSQIHQRLEEVSIYDYELSGIL